MGSYAVEVKPSARKELEGLPDHVLGRAVRKIAALADAPRPAGCKKLRGYRDLWRIRIGDWRVVYSLDDTAKVVSITRIAHRGEVYDS